jgi:hypothetical protein
MSDEQLGQELEQKAQQEEQVEVQKALSSEADASNKGDGKAIFIMLAVIIGVFALTFAGFKLYDGVTAAAVIDIDALHQDNLNGDLSEEEGYVYEGYSFVYVDGLWWTEVKPKSTLIKIPLHFGAKQVENISVQGTLDTKGFNNGKEVYIAVDPNIVNKYYTLSLSELTFNIVKGVDRNIITSCTENASICENRTIVNCDSTQGLPVIQLTVANETKVEYKGTCILISGDDYDLVRATDRVLLKWYGIMK